MIDRGVEVFDDDSFLQRLARALIRGHAMEVTSLQTATKHQDGPGIGEVPMHAVMLEFGDLVRNGDLVLHFFVRFAFDEHVAAELTGQNDHRSIEQAAFFQVEDELGNGRIDGFLEIDRPGVAVFMRVSVLKRNVFARDLDEASACFR